MTISANFPTVRPSLLLDFSNQTVLDPRVTFARTTTALYYDNKSAALAEQNLLLYSNTFTNAAWTSGISGLGTPVVGATDPAGGATAYTFTATAGSSIHYVYGVASGTPPIGSTFTFSCYLQAGAGVGSTTYATLSFANQSSGYYSTATFNLSGAGSVTQSGVSNVTAGTPTITQIGSTAWYRCSVTCIFTTSFGIAPLIQMNNAATFPLNGNGAQAAWTAAGTETLLVYGAQLEQRSAPTVYTATTATAVNTYTPTLQTAAINAPRFDYDPVTRTSLGLFTEQASTNLALYSSDYTNAVWGKTACTITATADISPDGTQNASLMVLSSGTNGKSLNQNITFTAGTSTLSFYLKYYGFRYVQIWTANNGNFYCNFDLISGQAGTPTGTGAIANIIAAGNGWYRCSITFTSIAATSGVQVVGSNSLTANASVTVTGDGFDGYLVWGAQVELAPSATSYIATVASAQTRTVDAASMTGTNFTSWYNYSGGTVYVEAATGNPTNATLPTSIQIGDGTAANSIAIFFTASAIRNYARSNNVVLQTSDVALPSATVANTFYKTAWYFSGAGNGVSSVGQTATTASTAINVPAVNQLNLSGSIGQSNILNGRIKKFAYYPLPLTNTQIQSLSAN